MSKSLVTIPFDEIVPGATARMTVIDDMQYLSIRDVFMHVGGYSSNTANKNWDRFNPEDKEELKTFCRQFRFPGPGNPTPTTVISFPGVLKLVMKIGGVNAKRYRTAMVKILTRYYAGDDSLTDEIQANAQSAAPIAQMARASLAAEPVQEERSLEFKRKREELELRVAEFEHITKVANSYSELCEGKVMDERARKIFKDNLLSKAMLQAEPSSMCTNPKPVKPGKKLTMSEEFSISIGKKPDVFKPSVGYYEMNDCGCYENDDYLCDDDPDYP